jgi:hypothetical protein
VSYLNIRSVGVGIRERIRRSACARSKATTTPDPMEGVQHRWWLWRCLSRSYSHSDIGREDPGLCFSQPPSELLLAGDVSMAGLAINLVQVFWTWLLQYRITIGSEATFLSALCVIRCPSYLLWSRTFLRFLLGVGLTDLGHFGRYFGQNKEIVSVFNGSVVYFNVGIGLTF